MRIGTGRRFPREPPRSPGSYGPSPAAPWNRPPACPPSERSICSSSIRSTALGGGAELIQSWGPDSYLGRVAAVMLGSTETTFYTIAVYFGSVGVSRTRYAIPAALCADLTGFLAAAWAVRLCFGGS